MEMCAEKKIGRRPQSLTTAVWSEKINAPQSIMGSMFLNLMRRVLDTRQDPYFIPLILRELVDVANAYHFSFDDITEHLTLNAVLLGDEAATSYMYGGAAASGGGGGPSFVPRVVPDDLVELLKNEELILDAIDVLGKQGDKRWFDGDVVDSVRSIDDLIAKVKTNQESCRALFDELQTDRQQYDRYKDLNSLLAKVSHILGRSIHKDVGFDLFQKSPKSIYQETCVAMQDAIVTYLIALRDACSSLDIDNEVINVLQKLSECMQQLHTWIEGTESAPPEWLTQMPWDSIKKGTHEDRRDIISGFIKIISNSSDRYLARFAQADWEDTTAAFSELCRLVQDLFPYFVDRIPLNEHYTQGDVKDLCLFIGLEFQKTCYCIHLLYKSSERKFTDVLREFLDEGTQPMGQDFEQKAKVLSVVEFGKDELGNRIISIPTTSGMIDFTIPSEAREDPVESAIMTTIASNPGSFELIRLTNQLISEAIKCGRLLDLPSGTVVGQNRTVIYIDDDANHIVVVTHHGIMDVHRDVETLPPSTRTTVAVQTLPPSTRTTVAVQTENIVVHDVAVERPRLLHRLAMTARRRIYKESLRLLLTIICAVIISTCGHSEVPRDVDIIDAARGHQIEVVSQLGDVLSIQYYNSSQFMCMLSDIPPRSVDVSETYRDYGESRAGAASQYPCQESDEFALYMKHSIAVKSGDLSDPSDRDDIEEWIKQRPWASRLQEALRWERFLPQKIPLLRFSREQLEGYCIQVKKLHDIERHS